MPHDEKLRVGDPVTCEACGALAKLETAREPYRLSCGHEMKTAPRLWTWAIPAQRKEAARV